MYQDATIEALAEKQNKIVAKAVKLESQILENSESADKYALLSEYEETMYEHYTVMDEIKLALEALRSKRTPFWKKLIQK
jgi:hypothetical protein